MKRLVAITTLLALGTGCIELSVDLSVAKSGSAKMHTDFAMADKAIAFLEGVGAGLEDKFKEIAEETGDPVEPVTKPANAMEDFAKAFGGGSDAQLAQAKAHGLKLKTKQAKEGIAFSIDAKAKTMRSLDWYAVAMGLKDEPAETGPTLVKNGDGTVTLTMAGTMGGNTPLGEMMADKPEGMPDMDEMGAMMAGMVAQMGAPFEISNTITVPGRIVSASPDIALSIDGSTASWDFSIQELMTFGQNPEPFSIVFEPKGKLSPTLFE